MAPSSRPSPRKRGEGEKHVKRPRAHRAVGRLPPASRDRSAVIRFPVSCESGRKIGAERERRQPWRYARPRAPAARYNTAPNVALLPGPVSDHFDGERFFDPHGAPPQEPAGAAALAASIATGAAPRRNGRPGRRRPMPTARRRGSTAPACRISYVGHASFLIQTAGLNILLDPVWSMRASPFSLRRTEARQRSGHRVRGSAADRCRPGLARAITIISMSRRCRGLRPRIARASSRRSATMPSCAIMIRRSRPKPTTGTIASRSAAT